MLDRQSKSRGFTLIELVAVIAVMSILAATAMPRFASPNTFNTRGDTGVLASALRYANKTAIAQHRNVFVVVATATRNIRLCYAADCSSGVIDPATSATFNQTLSNAVTVAASATTVGFDALGRPLNSAGALLANNATFTVANASNASQSTVLTVEAETGYVR